MNQYGQPCDSLGNPLVVPAQPQVVYVNAAPPAYAGGAAGGTAVYVQPQPQMTMQPQMSAAPAMQPQTVIITQTTTHTPAVKSGGGAAVVVQSAAGAAPAAMNAKAKGVAEAFKSGRVVVLQSVASGKSLRCADAKGNVEGKGAHGEFAQWTVHVVAGGSAHEPHVKLQNVKFPAHYLRIDAKKELNSNGSGGEYTEFAVIAHDNGTLSLQSVYHKKNGGHALHVGILPDGGPKAPENTGQGPHGRFTPTWVK